MSTARIVGYRQFLNQLYRDASTEPLSKYLPGRAAKLAATARGSARSIAVRRANDLFDRLTRRSV